MLGDMEATYYPTSPAVVPAALTKPSARYRRHAWMAALSLALFLAVYLGLAVWFLWLSGVALHGLSLGKVNFLILTVGTCAGFLALFLIKALFFIRRASTGASIEITPAEQPRIFSFLHRLADETGAPRPHRVFVSAGVNACVFFDLTVLNLFFPSRKNLEIGLGLVNVLTLSEFKAVLAHELGHFAQRSMAIGSWVYIARQIAEQIVARRDLLDRFLKGLSRSDIRVAWVGWLLSFIIWSLRLLMDGLLRLVVLAERALSRQMEFQADLVAVSVTGSDELVHALHKIGAADVAWQQTLEFASTEISQSRKTLALHAVQRWVLDRIAIILGRDDWGRVPDSVRANGRHGRVFKAGFAKPPIMWSTHPDNRDREENAKQQYIEGLHDSRSAWELFVDPEPLQSQVAERLYTAEAGGEVPSRETTWKALEERYHLEQYHPRYRGAYLGRSLTRHAARASELSSVLGNSVDPEVALDTLYSPAFAEDLKRSESLREELFGLEALRLKAYEPDGGRIVFRGRAVGRSDLPGLINDVKQELAAVNERLQSHDHLCRSVHRALAETVGVGWDEYLTGLLTVLHYAEHTAADLQDAHMALQVVLGEIGVGRLTSRKLGRLLERAQDLQQVLETFQRQKQELVLDPQLRVRLGAESWSALVEDLKLTAPLRDNLGPWLDASASWVNAFGAALDRLRIQTLDQMLQTEQWIAERRRRGFAPRSLPGVNRAPAGYRVLIEGAGRPKDFRFGWWARFLLADGWVAVTARMLLAIAVIGGVLVFGSVTVR
jgi:Zn-dependent protease with chaperone function